MSSNATPTPVKPESLVTNALKETETMSVASRLAVYPTVVADPESEPDAEIRLAAPTAREVRFVIEQLGDVTGKRVLVPQPANGELAVFLAKRGASVIVSGNSLSETGARALEATRQLAESRDTELTYLSAETDRLPMADESVDFIVAEDLLPGVNSIATLLEFRRALKPDGRALLIEQAYNAAGEKQLTWTQREKVRAVFPNAWFRGFWLFERKDRIKAGRRRSRLDSWLLSRTPLFNGLCKSVVITLRK